MDFTRPVETLVPGAVGRLLGALARVDAELSVSTLAAVAGVGRTRASAILGSLARLGVVRRRRVGATVLVRLERSNAAGLLLARLADLRGEVIGRLRELARSIDPQPASLVLFGSLARGDAAADSDVDMLAVRIGDEDCWAASLSEFSARARVLTGNRVQLLDYQLDDLRDRYTLVEGDAGAEFWRSVTRDALTLAGSGLGDLLRSAGHAAR